MDLDKKKKQDKKRNQNPKPANTGKGKGEKASADSSDPKPVQTKSLTDEGKEIEKTPVDFIDLTSSAFSKPQEKEERENTPVDSLNSDSEGILLQPEDKKKDENAPADSTDLESNNTLSERQRRRKITKKNRKLLKKVQSSIANFSLEDAGAKTEGKDTSRPSGSTSSTSMKRKITPGGTPEMTLKRPRPTFSQMASRGITLKITSKEDIESRILNKSDLDYIKNVLEDAMLDVGGSSIRPKIDHSFVHPEGLRIICRNKETLVWCKELINGLAPPPQIDGHAGYVALGPGDQPPRKKFFAWIPGDKDPERAIKLLGACNEGVDPKGFKIRAVIPGETGKTLVLRVDQPMVAILEKENLQLHCGVGIMTFRRPIRTIPNADPEEDPEKEKETSESKITDNTSDQNLSISNIPITPNLENVEVMDIPITISDSAAQENATSIIAPMEESVVGDSNRS